MDESSGYCGSGGGIKSVSDAAKIANIRNDSQALERDEIILEKDSVESNMEPRFLYGRHTGHYGFGGREEERGVDYFGGLVRQTDKKEFSFRGIESKVVRRHPR